MSKKSTPRIAIVGAGPGGLMLASILHHNNIPSIIFERETNAAAREQGGTLDLHPATGQRALKAAGLLDVFRRAVRQGGESMKLFKKDGTLLLEENDDGDGTPHLPEEAAGEGEEDNFIPGRPEIDRPILKDLLIASLPADTIRWATKVVSVEPVPGTEKWTISTTTTTSTAAAAVAAQESAKDKKEGPFGLVIGADGAWSRVRSLLTEVKPLYSGVTALDVCAHDVDDAQPDVGAFVGLGNCFIFSADRALLFQRNGAGRARCYACVRTTLTSARAASEAPPTGRALLGLEEGGEEVDWSDARNRKSFVESNFPDYFAEATRTVLAMADDAVLRPLYMLPVGLTWAPRPGVTVLGDAAHLMTPFAGIGVNVALVDALELAEGIIDFVDNKTDDAGDGPSGPPSSEGGGGELARTLAAYEKGMFERSSKDAAQTYEMMEMQFRDDGPERMMDVMMSGPPPGE